MTPHTRPPWRRQMAAVFVLGGLVFAGTSCTTDQDGDGGTTDTAPTPDVAEEEELVVDFSGDGDDTTDAFEVEDGWEIRWETTGESFQVEPVEVGGDSLGTVIDHEGEGGGSTYPPRGGEYELQVTADGPWTIRILNHGAGDS